MGSEYKCELCDGEGTLVIPNDFGGFGIDQCPACNGTGKFTDDANKCAGCDG